VFLGLTSGELFVIGFVTLAVVSAPMWPRLGAAIALRLAGAEERGSEHPEQDDSSQ
jgi:hypothetical protein